MGKGLVLLFVELLLADFPVAESPRDLDNVPEGRGKPSSRELGTALGADLALKIA